MRTSIFTVLGLGVGLGAGCALIGCGAGDHPPLDEHAQAIIHGEPSPEEENAAVAVVLTTGGGFAGGCSGVIVAPTIVLTARHCVSETEPGGLACTKEGTSLGGGGVLKDHAPGDLAILVGPKVSFSFSARGKKIIHNGAKNLCNNDMAILILDKPITGTPIAPMRLDSAPVKGDLMTAVGWGQSDSSGIARRHRLHIPIMGVGPGTYRGGIGPNELAVGESICSGDSGGPAFDEKTGAVIAVVSRGGNGNPDTSSPINQCVDTADYKTGNFYTRTDGFKDMILSAFTEAGEKPWLEGTPDPRKSGFGETCTGPEICRSSLCLDVGTKKFCSQACDDATPCPDGYTCTDLGTKVCTPSTAAPAPVPAAPSDSKGGCAVSVASAPGATSAAAASLVLLLAVGVTRRARR